MRGRLVLAAISLFALLLPDLNPALIERGGWPFYDSMQKLFAREAPRDAVVILITQRSLDEFRDNPDLKLGWPWPREVYGAMVDTAGAVGAKSVHFDLLFDSPSTYGVADDESFNEALKKTKVPIVFPAPTARAFQKPNPRISAGLEGLLYGAVNLPVEADGVYRRSPREFAGIDGATYPALGFATLARPTDRADLWMRFYRADSIATVDASEVFRIYRATFHGGELDADAKAARALLEGRHWFVGLSAAGLYDLRPTPTEPRAPGVFLHATMTLNAIEDAGVAPLAPWSGRLYLLAAALVLTALVFRVESSGQALLVAASWILIASFGVSTLAWSRGLWLNPMPSFIALLLSAAAQLSYRFQTEWRERSRLAKSVENSMSTEMVELIRRGRLQLARFGERRTISILFSDLSGFTSLAEATDAAKLVEILNLYLDECVDLIFKKQGYVDKFIGDAIMALWGAPMTGQADHARLALDVALRYSEAVAKFNLRAREKFGFTEDLFTARVGLHTGPAIVGNIGSHSRYNYTAIGDSVNLASRLEGLGKYYGVTLLVSEEAVQAAGAATGGPELFLVDRVAVKGRSTPVTIYSQTNLAVDVVNNYETGRAAYAQGRWREAIGVLEKAKGLGPAEVLIERCQTALTEGQLKQFKDGVWHHDEK